MNEILIAFLKFVSSSALLLLFYWFLLRGKAISVSDKRTGIRHKYIRTNLSLSMLIRNIRVHKICSCVLLSINCE